MWGLLTPREQLHHSFMSLTVYTVMMSAIKLVQTMELPLNSLLRSDVWIPQTDSVLGKHPLLCFKAYGSIFLQARHTG
jgi:hypothetical protein